MVRRIPPIEWTPEMDRVICDMRAAGALGDFMSDAVGVSAPRIFRRLAELGQHTPDTRQKHVRAERLIGPGRRPKVTCTDILGTETLQTLDALMAQSPHGRPLPPDPPPTDTWSADVWVRHHVQGVSVCDIARRLRVHPSAVFDALARHKRHLDAAAWQRAHKAGHGPVDAWTKTRAMLNGVLSED